jgi:hypothetical protein
MRRKGLRPDEYKILNVGTARLGALISGNVPAAVLNSLETIYAAKQGFRVLARAAEVIELSTGGLGASMTSLQNKRESFRTVIQATLECIRITATEKERVLPRRYETAISIAGGLRCDLRCCPHRMGIGRQTHGRCNKV